MGFLKQQDFQLETIKINSDESKKAEAFTKAEAFLQGHWGPNGFRFYWNQDAPKGSVLEFGGATASYNGVRWTKWDEMRRLFLYTYSYMWFYIYRYIDVHWYVLLKRLVRLL